MRHCRPAKQCLWLGPGRYRGCCRYAIADSDTNSCGNTNTSAYRVWGRDCNSNTNCYGDSYTDSHGNSDTHSNGDCHSYTNSHSNPNSYWEATANGKAASHASAAAIESRRTGNFWCSVTGVGNRWFVVLGRRARSAAPYLHMRTRADLGRAGSPLHADFHRALPRPD